MNQKLDYDQLFPGRFIKAGDLQGRDVTLTISGIELQELPNDKGGDITRGVISFERTKKQWVINRTNASCLRAMWDRDTSAWIGKRVTLYATEVSFGKERVLAIRVKGSPDIERDTQVEVKLPRRRPTTVTLRKTQPRPGSEPEQPPEPEQQQEADENGTF